MSSIAAGTTSGLALVSTGDTTGELVLKTNGSTTAVTIGTDQSVTLAGALDVGTTLDITGATTATSIAMADNLLTRPVFKDYAVEGVAIGNTGATRTIDLESGNFFSATLDQACVFTFSNPAASGDYCGFVFALTNGGSDTITWPASVDWAGGTPPTLTASGLDLLIFTSYDAGITWLGLVAGLDIK
jgi:hypothetical protein